MAFFYQNGMDNKRLFPLMITAIVAVIFSISICFLVGSNMGLNGQHGGPTENENQSSDRDTSNNVQNNGNGDQADVSNSIDNHLNDSNNNQIENNVLPFFPI
ncbi:hypothetical protein MUO14_13785 [Halobacillus shinanisalinarum]|uniref:Uncharacterized protein n=1 Tax=Halobacillus shinanisalinarum TaxID=2932258 RepID=A0ABY4GXX2_9BACI|nr:hypothetical protein [Halobacillus shinanisalinarum]UOQ91627.1 hypothetical protein MUO14_13785 [Halobacillus shinanisalinarum]